MWYDKLFNVKYLPLFHHFKVIYQFPKHIILLVKIVANASLSLILYLFYNLIPKKMLLIVMLQCKKNVKC